MAYSGDSARCGEQVLRPSAAVTDVCVWGGDSEGLLPCGNQQVARKEK